MLVLGIDPGIANTGYGVVRREKSKMVLHESGTITTPRNREMPERLEILYEDVRRVVRENSPEVAVLEELFFSANLKTAMAVGQARGVIMLAVEHEGLKCFEYTPLQVKRALVGQGNADKKQVRYMVSALLEMDEPPSSTHASDALALCICHLHHEKMEGLLAGEGA